MKAPGKPFFEIFVQEFSVGSIYLGNESSMSFFRFAFIFLLPYSLSFSHDTSMLSPRGDAECRKGCIQVSPGEIVIDESFCTKYLRKRDICTFFVEVSRFDSLAKVAQEYAEAAFQPIT